MDAVEIETCTQCNARWFDMCLKNGMCHGCLLKDKHIQIPYFFLANNEIDPGIVPAYLPALTQVEEIVIAQSHIQMMIKHYRGYQYQYTGHCVSFVQEIVKTVSILPNFLEELDIILLYLSRQAVDDLQFQRQFIHDFRVRKGCILTWLQFLKAHHPDYQYITICNDQVQSLPDDGDVSHLFLTLEVGDDDELGSQKDVPSSEGDSQLPNTQSTVLNSFADDTEIN
jgi:hypothetical protein